MLLQIRDSSLQRWRRLGIVKVYASREPHLDGAFFEHINLNRNRRPGYFFSRATRASDFLTSRAVAKTTPVESRFSCAQDKR